VNLRPRRLSRAIDRDLNAVSELSLAVKALAATVLDEFGAASVELALVEALNNAIKHGSIHGREAERISVTADIETGALVIEVIDKVSGIPQEMLDKAEAHILDVEPEKIMDLSTGGRGLSIIVLSMDEVKLRTTNDTYVLTMKKYFGI